MKNAVTKQTRLAIFAPLAVAALVAVFITSNALAGKPGGGTTSGYNFVTYPIVPENDIRAMNNAGQLAARITGDPVFHQRPAIVIPEDTNRDGLPDRWFRDSNADGVNDLLINLGQPAPYAASQYATALAQDINDHGQVLAKFIPSGFFPIAEIGVVTPSDVNGDGKLEWFAPDANGANLLMTPLDIGFVSSDFIYSLNIAGQMVGHVASRCILVDARDTDGDGVADTWFEDANGDGVNDLVIDLGLAKDSTGQLAVPEAIRVNDSGWVIGSLASGEPFVLIPATDPFTGRQIWYQDADQDGANDLIVRLPLLTTGSAKVCDINSTGVMVGHSTVAGGTTRAVMWRVDAQGRITVTSLGTFGSMTYTYAKGINDKLQIVGYGLQYNKSGRVTAASDFIWQNGTMKDLGLAPDSLVTGGDRLDINEAGIIWSSYTMAVPIVPAP